MSDKEIFEFSGIQVTSFPFQNSFRLSAKLSELMTFVENGKCF